MEAEGQGPTIHEQAEATQPEQLQLQTQMEHHQMQPQIEQMPMEGVQAYEQHMQGNEAHLQHPEAHMQGQMMDPNMAAMAQGEHAHMLGVPAGLPQLQAMPQDEEGGMEGADGEDPPAKFKPINLERLSPKSKQRVLRNRQAATRSKAKKKQQFQGMKDKKTGLDMELEQLEAQINATELRMGALHAENKALMEACKCGIAVAQQ